MERRTPLAPEGGEGPGVRGKRSQSDSVKPLLGNTKNQMKMEFLPDGSPDCPLIRLFEFTSDEARQLQGAVLALSLGASPVAVHELPFVESVGNCRLTLQVEQWDQGVTRASEVREFVCRMTCGTWDDVAALMEPFVNKSVGYQWLSGTPGEANLLLSRTGEW